VRVNGDEEIYVTCLERRLGLAFVFCSLNGEDVTAKKLISDTPSYTY
jgi:hypothetical protein